MKLYFLKDEALTYFKNNISSFKEFYKNENTDWMIKKYQELTNTNDSPFGEFKVEVAEFKMDTTSLKPEKSDIKNVKLLYLGLRNISESQAMDERFWSGLAHTTFYEYVKYRVSLDNNCDESKILNSFYFNSKNGKKKSLSMNPLSRLWWIGRLIYDESSIDPFNGIEFLENNFSGKTLFLLSNNFASNPKITRSVLKSCNRLISNGFKIDSGTFNEFLKYLNVIGGIIILDYLAEEELVQKLIDYYYKANNLENVIV